MHIIAIEGIKFARKGIMRTIDVDQS